MKKYARLDSKLLAAVLCGRQSGAAPIDEVSAQHLLDSAEQEGVTVLLEYRLRASGELEGLPESLRLALTARARTVVMRDMARQHELRQVASALAEANVRSLVLKGNALGLWLYPEPYLRRVSDIDLLVASHEEIERAWMALVPLGFAIEGRASPYQFERTAVRMLPGGGRSELDLHARLLNAPAFADILPFDVLWANSMAVGGLPETMRALCPVHALLHASMNRALDTQFGVPDTLRLLYDVHLLALKFTPEEWSQLQQQATERAACGIAHAMLVATIQAFSTPVPADVMQMLWSQSQKELLDASRLGDWRYMQRMSLRALPGAGARLRWLWHRFLPGRENLHKLHGDAPLPILLWRRVRHGLHRLLS